MISILDDVTRVANGRADFVVFGDNIDELMQSSTANSVLQKAAALGLNRPGVSNATGAYPVDADGNTDNDLLLGKRGAPAGYRREFVILASI